MKRTTKSLALLIALAVCLCGVISVQAETVDPFGKFDETVVVTAVKSLGAGTLDFPPGDSIDDNVWTRKYLDALNVQVKFLWTTNDQQYNQKVNIAITANDLPDVMSVNNTQLKMMHENEQLFDMTEVLPTYTAPFTWEVLNADGGAGLASATFDGKLYAVPAVGSGLGSAKVLWVRTDWLENLGLSIPTTVDEFMSVAEAFTFNDPDGNGENDTYGLAVYKDLFGTGYSCLEAFFNMHGAYPNIWVEKDGKLAFGSVQPEDKTALGALQDMYAKGLLDPEFGVKDANKVNEDVGAGRFGLMFGDFWNAAWINNVKVENPTMEWVPVAIPSNNGVPAKAQIPFGTSTYYAISANAKNPDAIVKMLNLQLEKGYGETAESTVYNITPEGYGPYAYTVIAVEPAMKNFTAAEKVTWAVENSDPSKLNDEELNYYEMSLLSLGGDHANNNWHQLKMFGPGGSLGVMKKYWDEGNVVPNAFYGVSTQTMTEKLSTLDKQQLTDFTKIILGAPLDDFDTFVSNWNKLGGEQMTAEVNEWYAQQ
ncbi:hypothetical protein FACS1894184_08870 [Clostridia bacterium]|nr:hypothetical protein FACS1894184_08870 [Clostridia bacterium]